jgi:hypothetical protein
MKYHINRTFVNFLMPSCSLTFDLLNICFGIGPILESKFQRFPKITYASNESAFSSNYMVTKIFFTSGFGDFFDIIMTISGIGLMLGSMLKPFPNNHFSLKWICAMTFLQMILAHNYYFFQTFWCLTVDSNLWPCDNSIYKLSFAD